MQTLAFRALIAPFLLGPQDHRQAGGGEAHSECPGTCKTGKFRRGTKSLSPPLSDAMGHIQDDMAVDMPPLSELRDQFPL